MSTIPEMILLVGTFGVIVSFGAWQTNYSDLRNIYGMARCTQDLSNIVCQQCLDGVVGRLLVDMVAYAKSCEFNATLRVFDEIPYHDIAIWNVLISGYKQNERPKEALDAFNELQDTNVEPNQLTLIAALLACSQLGAIERDMYSKCGDLENALYVFRFVKNRNVVIWSSMIAGLTMLGRGKEALDSFKEIQAAKVKLSHVTFTNIFSACGHVELLEEGRMYSSQMLPLNGIAPNIEHYGCMVDILGHTRCLEEEMDPRCKVIDPGGLIIISTSISLPMTCLDGVELF
ncbi:hypothetical protein IEQ34_016307 [Dendrobium chrysotoxum]|uniref:Pentatricopeptide repeat-containing protein n=1 Tax=Dendrobium chrysotoxum TaxID=161865 RepID=A0AAV7GG50_DENCH|nr:hypothetical protein IEQ34_016307 [Dendrobium chrysotoxum]